MRNVYMSLRQSWLYFAKLVLRKGGGGVMNLMASWSTIQSLSNTSLRLTELVEYPELYSSRSSEPKLQLWRQTPVKKLHHHCHKCDTLSYPWSLDSESLRGHFYPLCHYYANGALSFLNRIFVQTRVAVYFLYRRDLRIEPQKPHEFSPKLS